MKVRQGFVSNSSSTSYIVILSRNFKTTQEKVEEFMKQYNEYTDFEKDMLMDLEQADKKIDEIVNVLCSQEQVWTDYDAPVQNISCFINVFNDDVVIASIDGGPDASSITNIFADECRDKNIDKLHRIIQKQ